MEKKGSISWRQLIKESSLVTLCLITLYGVLLLGGAGRLAHAASLAERRIPVQHIMTNPEGWNAPMWETVNLVKETWERELGLTIKKDVRDHDDLLSTGFYGGNFDMMIVSFGGASARLDPGYMLPLRFYATCEHYYPKIPKEECPGGGGAFNCMGYYNPEFNKLIDKQKEVFDYEERKKILDKAIELTIRDRAALVMFAPHNLDLMNTRNWKDEIPMVGEGISSFWNTIEIKPKGKYKTLKVGSVYALDTLNPLAIKSANNYRAAALIYDRIMRIDTTGKPIKWMAEEVTGVDGPKGRKTIIRIKLRKDLKFHDGVPLTTDDVKFSFDFAKKYNAPALSAYLKNIDSVEKEGKYYVKIYLNSPWSAIPHVLFARMFIIPKHIWEKVPKETDPVKWANRKPIGSGPFKFESWERGSQLVLSKFKDYFYPVIPERFVRTRFENVELLAASIEKGGLDLSWDLPIPATIATRAQKKKNVKLIITPSHGYINIDIRLDKRPYSDLVFRKALDYCLPRNQIIERMYHGFADYAVSVIPPGNKAWHNPKVFYLASEYNPEKGRQILKEAGYEWDAKGHLCYPR